MDSKDSEKLSNYPLLLVRSSSRPVRTALGRSKTAPSNSASSHRCRVKLWLPATAVHLHPLKPTQTRITEP